MAMSLRSRTAFAALSLVALSVVTADGDWTDVSATYFGQNGWSLHEGSCEFGFICPSRWSDELASGHDVVAVSSASPLYSGSPDGSQCGQCLEVKCRDGTVVGGNGKHLDRRGYCIDESQSVKVKITDTCKCHYPENASSNARWCCKDHLDMSQHSLAKLVRDELKKGVFSVKYRKIDCGASVSAEAPANAASQFPDKYADKKPSDLKC